MNEPIDPARSPGQPALDYASPRRGEPPRALAWAVVAAITITACAVTFGVVYWSMGRPFASRRRPVWAPIPLGIQPAPLPQFTPGMGSPGQASLAPGRAELARCATHLQHIAAALQAWANRHDWRLPDRLEDLVAAGLLERGDLLCPAGDSSGGAGGAGSAESAAYLYVGKGLSTPVAAETVVVYEPPLHVGGLGMNVLFGDGGIRLLTGDDASRLMAEAQSGRLPLRYTPGATKEPAGVSNLR